MKEKKKIQIVGVGGLILDNQGKLLLVQRNEPEYKAWDNKWSIPGGHLKFGEKPKETLSRELIEELGVKIEFLKETPFVTSYVLDLGKIYYHGILLCYPCRIVEGEPKIANQENRDFKWINPERIDFQDCIPATDHFVKQLLANKEILLK